jgi:HemY protein
MGRAVRAAGDPVWTADGVVSDRWLPVTPNGRLDGFEWKLPLAEIGVSRPLIEVSEPVPQPIAPAEPQLETKPPEPPPEAKPEQKPAVPVRPVEAVIPLVHAPDDPGPDSALESDPVAEVARPRDAWQRIKQLFR